MRDCGLHPGAPGRQRGAWRCQDWPAAGVYQVLSSVTCATRACLPIRRAVHCLTGNKVCLQLVQGSSSQTTACSSATHPPATASEEQSSGLTGTPRWGDRLVCSASSAFPKRTHGPHICSSRACTALSGFCAGSCLPPTALPAVLMGRDGAWSEPGGFLPPGDELEGVRMGLVCCAVPRNARPGSMRGACSMQASAPCLQPWPGNC